MATHIRPKTNKQPKEQKQLSGSNTRVNGTVDNVSGNVVRRFDAKCPYCDTWNKFPIIPFGKFKKVKCGTCKRSWIPYAL